jgi:hypothetical protein
VAALKIRVCAGKRMSLLDVSRSERRRLSLEKSRGVLVSMGVCRPKKKACEESSPTKGARSCMVRSYGKRLRREGAEGAKSLVMAVYVRFVRIGRL